MTALPQPDELTRQLRSLSIVRPAETPQAPPVARRQADRSPRRGGLAMVLTLALLAGAGAAVWHWQDNLRAFMTAPREATQPAPVAETPVQVATPVTAPVAAPAPGPAVVAAARLVGSGYVLAGRVGVIGTDTGGRLTELLVAVGDTVRRGQPVARFDDVEARMAVESAGLALQAAMADEERLGILRDQAAARTTRVQSLAERGSVPMTEAEDAVFELRLAEAEIAAARLTVTRLGIDRDRARDRLDRLTVTAPFDGIITETRAVAGDLIGSSLEGGPAPGVAVLMDPASLRVEADLAETALSQVTVGQSAEVVLDAWPEARLSARVAAILPRVSLQKGTITLRLDLTEVPPDVALLANMAAKITLVP